MAKASKRKNLLSEVAECAGTTNPGCRSWFHRLPPDARDELDAVREAFLHGELRGRQKKAVARAVMAAAVVRGWKTSGIQGVIAWLNAGNS